MDSGSNNNTLPAFCDSDSINNSTDILVNANILQHSEASHNTKISINNNKIRIFTGTLKAVNPVSLSVDWSISSKSKDNLLSDLLDGFKRSTSRKRLHRDTRAVLGMLLANLEHSRRIGAPILYSRRVAESKNRLIIEVIDFLAGAGILQTVIGKANEYDENGSFFVPTFKFDLLAERERIRLAIATDASFIELRAKKKRGQDKGDILPIKKTRANRLQLHSLSAPVVAYNAVWLSHSATVAGRELNPFTRRIFNQSLGLGGRFYSTGYSHQQIKKAERKLIRIDDCNTIEPDFKAMHPTILYAWEGIQLSPDEIADLYSIDGYDRSVIKSAVLILINCSSEASFQAMVTKSGKAENSHLEGFIEGLPDGINGSKLLAAIKDKHAPIAHHFGSKNIGLRLQRLDSDIIASAVHSLAALDVPVLPVHDSIRCKVTDRTLVVNTMFEAFKTCTGYTPIIDF